MNINEKGKHTPPATFIKLLVTFALLYIALTALKYLLDILKFSLVRSGCISLSKIYLFSRQSLSHKDVLNEYKNCALMLHTNFAFIKKRAQNEWRIFHVHSFV